MDTGSRATIYRLGDQLGLKRADVDALIGSFGEAGTENILTLKLTGQIGEKGMSIGYKSAGASNALTNLIVRLSTRIAENDAKLADLQRDQTQIKAAIKERQFDRVFPGMRIPAQTPAQLQQKQQQQLVRVDKMFPGMRIPVNPDEGKKQQYVSMLNRVFPDLLSRN